MLLQWIFKENLRLIFSISYLQLKYIIFWNWEFNINNQIHQGIKKLLKPECQAHYSKHTNYEAQECAFLASIIEGSSA